jgi:histidinol dehydrogenase
VKILGRPPEKKRLQVTAKDLDQAARLVRRLKKGKKRALQAQLKRDGGCVLSVSRDLWSRSMAALPKPLFRALELSCRQLGIRTRKQLSSLKPFILRPTPGWSATQKLLPIPAMAIVLPAPPRPRVPALLAAAIPAALAGVETRVICTPPKPTDLSKSHRSGTPQRSKSTRRPKHRLEPTVLAAAHMAEATDLFCLGGPAAVTALALGLPPFPQVGMIIAPAEPQTMALRTHLMPLCAAEIILTGAAELMIVAEGQARFDLIAAELIAHLERHPHGCCGLLTTNPALAAEVKKELRRLFATAGAASQAKTTSTSPPQPALYITHVNDEETLGRLANERVPDHLWLLSSAPERWIDRLHAYSTLHVGPHAAELLGESGCSPTLAGSYGDYWRPMISALDFLQVASVERIVPETYRRLGRAAATIAEAEGRPQTARAALSRLDLGPFAGP